MGSRRRNLGLLPNLAAGMVFGLVALAPHGLWPAQAKGAEGREPLRFSVEAPIEAANGRRWRAGYDVEVKARAVWIVVRVRLVPGPGVSPADLHRRVEGWRGEVARYWSDRIAVSFGGDPGLPLRAAVSFGAHDAHHTVIVKRRHSGTDMLSWPLHPRAGVIAHEFGHMIGAYDEYRGGGTDPETPVIDPDGVMAGAGARGGAAERHFWHVLQSLDRQAARLGLGPPSLVRIGPEG